MISKGVNSKSIQRRNWKNVSHNFKNSFNNSLLSLSVHKNIIKNTQVYIQ